MSLTGKELRRRRIEARVSQVDLADAAGTSQSALSKMESGRRRATQSVVDALRKYERSKPRRRAELRQAVERSWGAAHLVKARREQL